MKRKFTSVPMLASSQAVPYFTSKSLDHYYNELLTPYVLEYVSQELSEIANQCEILIEDGTSSVSLQKKVPECTCRGMAERIKRNIDVSVDAVGETVSDEGYYVGGAVLSIIKRIPVDLLASIVRFVLVEDYNWLLDMKTSDGQKFSKICQ